MSNKLESTSVELSLSDNSINEALWRKYVKITFVIILYWIVSISIVFVNKSLLSGFILNINAPLTVTWFQCTMTIVLCHAVKLLDEIFCEIKIFTNFSFSFDKMFKVLPLSVIFIAMISFNNLCLKYASVAFYYIGRSLTPVFNVVFTFIILREKTSFTTLLSCFIIIGGFYIGVDQEEMDGNLSLFGLVFGVLASMSVSLNSIYTKKVLLLVDKNIWALTYYNNLNASLLFIPLLIITGELSYTNLVMLSEVKLFWYVMLFSGILGFSISYVTALQIKLTSPLTHNISGTAKACIQTILACLWYHEKHSFLWWFSNFVILLGSIAYAKIRQLEMVKHQSKI